jgi:hypothetical protein
MAISSTDFKRLSIPSVYTYRGWDIPNHHFPRPPMDLNGLTRAAWYDRLEKLYSPEQPSRYRQAWISYLNATVGEQWNLVYHRPNWGPNQMGPYTKQMADYARKAENTFKRQTKHFSPLEKSIAQNHTIFWNEENMRFELDYPTLGDSLVKDLGLGVTEFED